MSTLREKLDFLVQMRGEVEALIFATAIEVGITHIYADAVAEAYLAGKIKRDDALTELGVDKMEELDYALECLERDVAWGLQNE